MKEPFKWDYYSDQPALLTDKIYKKVMRKKEFFSLVRTFLTALIVLPISLVLMPFIKRKKILSNTFFCMGIDYQRESELTLKIMNELEVKRVLLRIKLWDMDSLDDLKAFIEKLEDKKVTLKIMQDRENIEDLKLFEKNLKNIFTTLDGLIDIYEIGSTINRTKWGFFSVNEYNAFYQIAYNLQQNTFPHVKLIGSGVIDFEYHFTAHTLFNFFKYKYDGIAALLYVDRRGAPEHMQMGFALSDKIALLSTMVWLSKKSAHELHITETNYPLSNTAPYAPTSEHECIDEESYANFMVRYHFLAFASQQVDSLSWHQLIARGYGLIDTIGTITYRPAFQTYKYMVQSLNNAQFLRLDIKRDYYILQCLVEEQLLQIHWSLKDTTLKNEVFFDVYSRDGKPLCDAILKIGDSPIYIYITEAVPQKINCL
ncbi:glycosyl hydrolase [Sulfurimonas sp. SAG-AH-194-I05]|nr:glycosyl hydrolase [Sulfurimonas sp. SAG-AH-194-I05]MDF1874429.1 glycosyl hydrolase [Sulfurimonas sp. SAG-AH-194-I05]